jgi:hypothetical protein
VVTCARNNSFWLADRDQRGAGEEYNRGHRLGSLEVHIVNISGISSCGISVAAAAECIQVSLFRGTSMDMSMGSQVMCKLFSRFRTYIWSFCTKFDTTIDEK